jgi:nitronate monooxygenase
VAGLCGARRQTAAVMLPFGDPAPFVERIKRAGAPLIFQVQTVAMARDAVAKAPMYSSPKAPKPADTASRAGRWRWLPAIVDAVGPDLCR